MLRDFGAVDRRLVCTAFGGRAAHYDASAQQLPVDAQRCRFVWVTDLLPDALAPAIAQVMEKGTQAMQRALTPPPR